MGGVPAFAEQTMPAFHHAALAQRAVLELDVKLTRDGVPVILHDERLDRTTDRRGRLCETDLADFLACRADVLGTGIACTPVAPFVGLPTLDEVLRFAREHAVALNVEIENEPVHGDFDPTSAGAEVIARAIADSKVPQERLQVQSFWPGDLDAARLRRLHELKTGRLIAASVGCVLLLCGTSGPATIQLGRFAA